MVCLRNASLLVAICALSACAAGPNYVAPLPPALSVPAAYSAPASAGEVKGVERWWEGFGDAQLTQIVDLALAHNLDIDQAAARLRQAREALVQSRAGLFPSVSGSLGYSRNVNVRGRSFGNITNAGIVNENYSISGDAQYQLDLFGGVRRSVEAARGSAQASGYALAQTRISVAAEVARNYILARSAQASLAIAKGSLAIQDDNLEIAGFRAQAGLVSSLDTEQSRSQRAQTATQIPSLEQSFTQAVFRLGVLTGQAPGALKEALWATAPIPHGPEAVPVGLPADIIRLRPDVRSAERNLAVATAQIGVAKAQLFPALNIGASIGTNAATVSTLTDIITGRVFANLAQTIFDAGRNGSVVRARRAAADEALGAYKAAILGALEDVENALTAMATADARARDFAVAQDAATNAALLARSQYRAGLTDITTLNNTESALLSAQSGLSGAMADKAQAQVQLYLALGSGWDAGTPPQAPTSTK